MKSAVAKRRFWRVGELVWEQLWELAALGFPVPALSRRLLPLVTPTGLEPVFSP